MLRTDFAVAGPHIDDHKIIHRLFNQGGYVVGLKPGPENATQNVNILNGAITAARTGNKGQQVIIPPGDWYINDTVLISDVWGLIFRGTGLASRFVWSGPDDRPMFRLANCRQCRLSDFFIHVGQSVLQTGIQVLNAGGTITSMHNLFENIFIEGVDGRLQNGFYVGGGIDANNDFHHWSNCEVTNYALNGWLLVGSQSFNNMMTNCKATRGGEYGVRAGDEAWKNAGSFAWIGGGMSRQSKANFGLSYSIQPYRIDFLNSEKSARLLEARGAIVLAEISNCRWSGRDGLHPDNQVILAESWYLQLIIRNCNIGGEIDDPMPPLGFNINPSRGLSGLTFENNYVWSTAESIWTNQAPTQASGNMQILDHALQMRPI